MPDSTLLDFSRERLGDSHQALDIRTLEELREASIVMIKQTRRHVDIFSRSLAPPVYDEQDLTDTVKHLILARQRTRFRILIQDSPPSLQRGHRLVRLAQQLSSFIEVRLTSREHAKYLSAFLIVDRIGVIYRTFSDRYEGTAHFNDLTQANELSMFFNDAWENSVSDPNLRRMHI